MTFETLIKFFKSDLEIKKIISSLAPDANSYYETKKYSKHLEEGLKYLKYHICNMLNISDPSSIDFAEEFFNKLQNELYGCGDDFYDLLEFYQKRICEMREELIEEVGIKCVGYYAFNGMNPSKAKSINEMAHIIHQNLTNNEYVYKRMPEVKSKVNTNGLKITLYGDQTDLASKIFDSFYLGINVDQTDILSFDEKFLIMVRGRGHALSIEITKENENDYYIDYHIPKICNVEMARSLKGIRGPIKDNAEYATGSIRTTKDDLPIELIEFIEKVPTDKDIVKPAEKTI